MSEFDPRRTFYLKVNDNNLDGTLDLTGETPEPYSALAEAVQAGTEQADGQMGECFIYECRPVRRVRYGNARVTVMRNV